MALVVAVRSKLKDARYPERPVWYCRQPVGPASVSPCSYCSTCMLHRRVVVVSSVLMCTEMSTHLSVTSRNMCCPELMPQITGGLKMVLF